MLFEKKIIIPGGAGLVGQNLVTRLKEKGYRNIIVLDKHKTNIQILKKLHADVQAYCVDLSERGDWISYFESADVVIMLQAQIGDLNPEPFIKNNITSTKNVLEAIKHYSIPHTIHISSSVVNSKANDHYTNTKIAQENLVINSGINCVVLRPTLMFGWFDRKHLGWLARFMKKVPIFPIPGHGNYMRQPLYANDFCSIIISCMENRISGCSFNISGLERINYIDIVRQIKKSINANSLILKIPYSLFYCLLKTWSLFDKTPPFTVEQLSALVADDEFEEIDWPTIFNIKATPFAEAIHTTFTHPEYSKIALDF